MKFLLSLFAVLLVTALVANLAMDEPGFVLLSYGKTSIELPLVDFIVILLATILISHLLIRFLAGLRKTPSGLKRFRQNQQLSRSRKQLLQGLIQLAEGNWEKAEKQLVESSGKSELPVLGYLAAAHAAQRQKALDRRDDYLRMASRADPATEVAIELAQAELQMRSRQYEEALATLRHVEQKAPRHRFVKKLLARLYYNLRDWENLGKMIPALEKLKAVSDEELRKFEVAAYRDRFANANTLDAARQLWKQLGKHASNNPQLVSEYARSLMRVGGSEEAELLIRKTLNRQWSDTLLEAYGELRLDNPQLAINQASAWLEKNPKDPALLAALGRLSAHAELWGKARSLLTESINLRPTPMAYKALAELYERLDEPEEALAAYKAGFKLTLEQLSRSAEQSTGPQANHSRSERTE